jgi:hypothetical protein
MFGTVPEHVFDTLSERLFDVKYETDRTEFHFEFVGTDTSTSSEQNRLRHRPSPFGPPAPKTNIEQMFGWSGPIR